MILLEPYEADSLGTQAEKLDDLDDIVKHYSDFRLHALACFHNNLLCA